MSSSRNNFQFFNNPLAIRQEIQRFESVHPSIYAIYDLIELIPDQQIAQQIRDHVVCIEGKHFSRFIYSIQFHLIASRIFSAIANTVELKRKVNGKCKVNERKE